MLFRKIKHVFMNEPNERDKSKLSGHTYCLRGFIDNYRASKSFSMNSFKSRKEAENVMFSLIEKYDLVVDRNEFSDKHTNEVVCDRARFTILRLQ